MSEFEFVDVNQDGGMVEIALHRPPLNIMHIPMMNELNETLEGVVACDDVVAVLIRATGKAFCAGVDVADHSAEKTPDMIRAFHNIFRKLISTDLLSIAAVNGSALGGGCELASSCDIVLASDQAKFGQPEVHVGVFPPVAACLFPQLVGLKKAIELNVFGNTIDAAEAHRIGLVNHVFPKETFEADVRAFVERLGRLSRPVVRLAKRTTCFKTRARFLEHLDIVEAVYLNELMRLEDAQEGIAAFVQKRAPTWRHA